MSKVIDITGQYFGEWYVIKRSGSDKRGQATWLCRCSCGTERIVVGSTLRNGTSTSCGCMKIIKSRENNGTFVNEIGNRYGKLVVIAKDEELSIKKHRAHWLCQCDCGNTKIVSSKCLRDGKTKSCGCLISRGEEQITKILTKFKIKFISQYSIVIDKICYRFDFAILDSVANIVALIEYHGIQHYDNNCMHWNKTVEEYQKRDKIKSEWAKENGVPLYTIPYIEYDNLEIKIQEILNQIDTEEHV